MFPRLVTISKNSSFFMFGPRGSGKSTLIRQFLAPYNSVVFDLLDLDLQQELIKRPGLLSEKIEALPKEVQWIFIDEIQKIPELLDEVHRQIEKNKKRFFALTGSSARKLKQGKANLLAGRAFTYHLFPLATTELGNHFNFQQAMEFGSLPRIFDFSEIGDKKQFLKTYAQTYLREEIQMEALVKNLPSFHRFLPLAAMANGQVLSWVNFASDVGVDAKTIRNYFEILEDTLLGFFLPAFDKSLRKQQKKAPKFYFFDTGVKRALSGEIFGALLPGTSDYGRTFEHWCILEIARHNDYFQTGYKFSYFATHNTEIDLVVERPGLSPLLIEFKSSSSVKNRDLNTLQAVKALLKNSEALCISNEKEKRKVNDVLLLPWQEALAAIFPGN